MFSSIVSLQLFISWLQCPYIILQYINDSILKSKEYSKWEEKKERKEKKRTRTLDLGKEEGEGREDCVKQSASVCEMWMDVVNEEKDAGF